ncbi:hypothetical protein M8J77_010446 [Diaphorina citri]|nr:hypothetical protein M8J77_010446 [Diaphorina citri]
MDADQFQQFLATMTQLIQTMKPQHIQENTFLRAQFIRGLKDNWIREQLLQSTETEFNKIVEKATALEASRIECKELASAAASTTNGSKFDSQDVHKTSTRSRSSSRHYSRSRKPSTSRYPSSNSSDPLKPPYHKPPHMNLQALGLENCCLRCGNQNHKSSTCRTSFATSDQSLDIAINVRPVDVTS